MLSHPLITDRRSRRWNLGLASTIGRDELKNIVQVLSDSDETLKGNLTKLRRDIDIWFDSVMNRVSQQFVARARAITVLFSLALAFAMQLDAFSLMKSISRDPELRANLVAASEMMEKRAEKVLEGTLSTSAEADTAQVKGLKTEAQWVKAALDSTGLQLAPTYDGLWRYSPRREPFWGMLMMAGLLSLGAPFWFNALKTLSSLRPILADKVDTEAKDQPAPAK